MSKKNKNKDNKAAEPQQVQPQELQQEQVDATQAQEPAQDAAGDEDNVEQPADTQTAIEQLQQQLEHEKEKYLFLMADFDNYRKRTLKEKQELIKDGGRRAMEALLPVIDDMERAIDAIGKGGDLDSLKEGVDLIYNKFMAYLKSQNVVPIESTGQLFDTDLHEAVTTFPAPDEDMKGKVIDTVTRGYMINDKVLRHAKVVVGQ